MLRKKKGFLWYCWMCQKEDMRKCRRSQAYHFSNCGCDDELSYTDGKVVGQSNNHFGRLAPEG
mgnify:CR=1 FL=1